MRLEQDLRDVRSAGRKALVPYLVAGIDADWRDHVRAAAFAGADAIEIGIPFSDPMMDGVIIQEASNRALANGATFISILEELGSVEVDVPLIVMTYYNIFHHHGLERSAADLSRVGVVGTIVPDLSLEEVGGWRECANANGIASILMVAPSTPTDRAAEIACASQGFAYAQGRMAVTGLASSGGQGSEVVSLVRAASDIPVYIGIGISNSEQARAAAEASDGVIVGSALVQKVLDGEGASGVERFVGELRSALNSLG